MSDSAAEEPPCNKKEKTSLSPSFSLSSLPNEVALSCLALLPRSDHASLSRVSKRYRSLVASPELYEIRSQLGYSCFYVCLSIRGPGSTPRWFIISREKTVNRLMNPIPSYPSHPPEGSSVVSLDSGIYVVGGQRNGESRSSDVLLMDCRTHTWRHIPSMRVARTEAAAGVVDGKIYVLGGCKQNDNLSYGEVFDPKTQTWDTLPPLPDREEWDMSFSQTIVMDEKVYAVCFSKESLLYYSPNEGRWGKTKRDVKASKLRIKSYCFCVTEKVLYGCDDYGNVFWREPEESEWKKVKGLGALHNYFYKPVASSWERLPSDDLFRCSSKLRNFGRNIVIVWFKYDSLNTNVDIWCAEISFERRQDIGEIWGKFEWWQAVARVNRHPLSHIEVLYSAYVNV